MFEEDRQTGKTTKMLKRALAYVLKENESVMIVGHSWYFCNLYMKPILVNLLLELSFKPIVQKDIIKINNICFYFATFEKAEDLNCGRNHRMFYDHYKKIGLIT